MEEVVTFTNSEGKRLFGIVHIPNNTSSLSKTTGVNLLNPGIKNRVAPHRLNVKIARQLCQEGFFVLRFDPAGIGDSEGELPLGKSMIDTWGTIQRGLFVNDTQIANDYFLNNYNIESLIMIGNCGGAITALLTSKLDYRVNSIILIDVPVFLLDSDFSIADVIVSKGDTLL